MLTQPPSAPLPRLLYVEDESQIAQMVIEVLSEHYRVDHADTGEAGLTLALRRPHDIMVIDRRLPGMSGTDLVSKIRNAHIATPIILLTALGTVDDRVSGLDGGANDYLVKPFDFEELLARLRALRRAFDAQGTHREIGEWRFVPDSQAIYGPDGGRVTLTTKENQLLEALSASPNHVFTRAELLDQVFPGGDSKASVETYVHYLRGKTCHSIIETVRGRGYRLGDGA